MPRYFFHLQGSGAKDLDGGEFPNDEAARQEAVMVVREVSRSRAFTPSEKIVVTNDNGQVIYEGSLRPQG